MAKVLPKKITAKSSGKKLKILITTNSIVHDFRKLTFLLV